mgnify:CR=1 FL=1
MIRTSTPRLAVKIDGVEATVENVSNDSYKIARPFNILTSDKESDAAKDFVNYIMSADGQQNGSVICKDLKGVETGKMLRSCDDCVRDAVKFLENVLNEEK